MSDPARVHDNIVPIHGISNVAAMSFDDLAAIATATFNQGQLERDKDVYCGVPLAITKVSYRIPAEGQRGYVSLEGVTGSEKAIQDEVDRGRITNLRVRPNEAFVINDGSTGIRRQVTMVLAARGCFSMAYSGEPSEYDKPWTEWDSFTQVGKEKDQEIPEFSTDPVTGNPLVILVRHGLRVSEYDAFGQQATTYYLN